MGIISRLRRGINIKALSVTDPKAWNPSLWNMIGSQSLSGENVTEETALTYSAVWNAVVIISGTIGSLPLHMMRKTGGKTEYADKRAVYNVMHTKANPWMTAMALRECMSAHVLLWGNAYAEKVTNVLGEVTELWPITPDRVRLRWDDRSDQLVYEVRVNNQSIYFPKEKILHIPGLGFDGYQGYSVVGMARKSIGLGMAMETFGSLYFGNGTHPGVVVSHPAKLSQEAHDNLKKSLTEAHSSLGKSHRLLLLEEAMKIEKISIAPEESQFLESRQFQIPEISRWFNLPPHKLKDLTKSSFNNIETEQTSYVMDSILPWLIRDEQNYNSQLLTDADRKQGYYFKHIIEGLLRGDSQARSEFYSKMWGIGAMSINEIREKEDLDEIDGGDEHFVPLNMVPLSKIGEVDYLKKGDKNNEVIPQESVQAESIFRLSDRKQK